MKKNILILGILFVAVSCNKAPLQTNITPLPSYNYSHTLEINSAKLNVEIAKTGDELQHGLSNRASMNDSEGMLFDFGHTENSPGFWMKDMKFNLDLIWIFQNTIVGITENVPAPKACLPSEALAKEHNSSQENCNLPIYYPPSPVTQVLEVNAGWSKKNILKVGDEIKLIN